MEKLHGISVPEGGFYAKLAAEAKALIDGEDDLIANTANVASLVFHALNERQPDTVNWVCCLRPLCRLPFKIYFVFIIYFFSVKLNLCALRCTQVGFYFVRGTPPILVLGPFQGT
jgi:putative methionine-R-sulfoxide reductase with GAF domain